MENDSFITQLNHTQDGYLDYSVCYLKHGEELFQPFQFEIFDYEWFAQWSYLHWDLGFIVGFIYIGVIFGIQHLMKTRSPFDLKRELFWWNAFLGVFSLCGFIRVLPELIYKLNRPSGLYRSVCVMEGHSTPVMFWGSLFALSKFLELFDTVFIVLRKRPLVLLQWYHHFITLAGSWLSLPYVEPVNLHFMAFNYCVHSLMYPYFALRAKDIPIPKIVPKVITTLQFTQMVIDLFLVCYTAYYYYSGTPCYRDPHTLTLQIFGIITFNILFGNLFYKSVILKQTKKNE